MRSLALAAVLALAPRVASAETDVTTLDEERLKERRPPPAVSADLIDPAAHSRFHLVTRASFAARGDTFSGAGSVWTFEPKMMVRVSDHIAIGGAVPLTLDARTPGGDQFLLGNVRLSGAGGVSLPLDPSNGGLLGPRLQLGLGLDLYLPTHTEPGSRCGFLGPCPSAELARGLRAYEPALYTPDAVLARARTHLGFSIAGLHLGAELGFTPGWYVRGGTEGEALVLYGFGLRAEYLGFSTFAPFVELVGSGTLEAPDDLPFAPSPDRPDPLQLSIGARAFFGELAPALFVTVDLDSETAFFGLDLAGILRPTVRRAANQDRLDF